MRRPTEAGRREESAGATGRRRHRHLHLEKATTRRRAEHRDLDPHRAGLPTEDDLRFRVGRAVPEEAGLHRLETASLIHRKMNQSPQLSHKSLEQNGPFALVEKGPDLSFDPEPLRRCYFLNRDAHDTITSIWVFT